MKNAPRKLKNRTVETTAALQAQVVALEKQKEEGERDLEAIRLRWQEELVLKEQALKEAQNHRRTAGSGTAQTLYHGGRSRSTRQLDALKIRQRALDTLTLVRNSAKISRRWTQEQTSVMQALESDHRQKEESSASAQKNRRPGLRQRLEERRLALEAFLAMKKDEEPASTTSACRQGNKSGLSYPRGCRRFPRTLEVASALRKTDDPRGLRSPSHPAGDA